jgi:hypothetical protein
MPPIANRNRSTRGTRTLLQDDLARHKSSPRSQSIQKRRRRASLPRLGLEHMQRNVFDYYEKNQYQDDAGEIYSPEWRSRLTKWGEEFDGSMETIHDDIKLSRQHPEGLELGRFFQAHPVAGFSLWHVLQACYELDRSVCGVTLLERIKIAEWQNWCPFRYFQSPEVEAFWQKSVDDLSSRISNCSDNFVREEVASRMLRIAHAVHALEGTLSTLISIFDASGSDMDCSSWIIGVVRKGVDNKYQLIKNISPRG